MTPLASSAVLVGRILLAAMFVMGGISKLGDVSGTMAYTASGGIPGFLGIPAIALEIFGGLAILVGWQTRWSALALAAFCVVTAVLYHYIPGRSAEGMEALVQTAMMFKNLAIAGGFLVLAGFGAGAWSLDARQGRTPTVTA